MASGTRSLLTGAARTAELFDDAVTADYAAIALSELAGQPLPVCVDAFSVDAGDATLRYEVWLESGELTITAGEPSRYDVTLRFVTYTVTMPDGARHLRRVAASREHDRGIVRRDANGDLDLTSSGRAQLAHTARELEAGVRVAFCAPGDGDEYDLLFRCEPT